MSALPTPLPAVCSDNRISEGAAADIVAAFGPSGGNILSLTPAIIYTPDVYEYHPIAKGLHLTDHLEFEVDATNDAHVHLSLKGGGEFEVVIGGWGNKQSVLRAVKQGQPISRPYCSKVLSAGEFKR